jgi:hypothetical protein
VTKVQRGTYELVHDSHGQPVDLRMGEARARVVRHRLAYGWR